MQLYIMNNFSHALMIHEIALVFAKDFRVANFGMIENFLIIMRAVESRLLV